MRHLSARCLLPLVVAVYTLDIYIRATINTSTILATKIKWLAASEDFWMFSIENYGALLTDPNLTLKQFLTLQLKLK